MTIKQQGGIFGRNPSFNDVEINKLDAASGSVADFNFSGSAVTTASGIADFGGVASTVSSVASGTPRLQPASDGTINLGSAGSRRWKNGYFSGNIVLDSGSGIDFSATSGTGTSELFDDYEEGTWTPVVAETSSGGTVATGTFTGTYTKIGRMVTVNLTLTDITTAGMTAGNIMYIRGLPFTCGTGHLGSNMMRSVTYSGQIAPRTLDGQTYFYFYQYATGGAVTTLTIGGISSGVSDIWATVTYEV